jgi:hypothetical protein
VGSFLPQYALEFQSRDCRNGEVDFELNATLYHPPDGVASALSHKELDDRTRIEHKNPNHYFLLGPQLLRDVLILLPHNLRNNSPDDITLPVTTPS